MPDVLAIMSKAVFEGDYKRRSAKVGQVLPIDRYASSHKTLDALRDGGRLFVVTVRPPEDLWLVAVLEKPKRGKGAWVADENTVPIRSVEAFQAKLKAKKGRLGMSLQTPRALTPADVDLLLPKREARVPATKPKALEKKRTDLVHEERPLGSERERFEHIRDHGTVCHFLSERDLLQKSFGEHAAIVRAIDPAQLLKRQLRAGLIEELMWRAQEEAAERLGNDVPDWQGVYEAYPYVSMWGPQMDRVVVAGPDGVVADEKLVLKAKEINQAIFVEGDVLVVYEVGEREEAIWTSSKNERFASDTFWSVVPVPGLGATGGIGKPIQPGKKTPKCDSARTVFVEDGVYYCVVDDVCYELDPRTGNSIEKAMPERFKGRKGLVLEQAWLRPVPERAATSPVGAVGSFMVWREGKTLRAEGGDGRSFVGAPKGQMPHLLITMPERDGLYLIREAARDDRWSELVAPDGRTVVIPGYPWRTYCAGIPQHVADPFFALYETRDPAASRAIRDCDDKTARALLDAAMTAYDKNPDDDFEWDTYETVRPNQRWPELATAVRTLFPAIRDERLTAGVAAMAIQGAKMAVTHRGLVDALDEKERMPAPQKTDARFTDLHFWSKRFGRIHQHEGSLAAHLRRVDQFLFGDEPADYWKTSMITTRIWWEPLLLHARGLAWRLFAPGTPKDARKEIRELLGLWAKTELSKRTSELRYIGVKIPKDKFEIASFMAPQLWAPKNRYVMRMPYVEQYYVVERTTDGTFVDLPNAELLFEHRPPAFDLEPALALYDDHGPVGAPSLEVAERIAKGTGISVDAAKLAWSAVLGFEIDTTSENRAALGVKSLARAVKEVSGASFDEIYAEAMPDDARDLLEPLAPGKSGEPAVDRFVRVWNARQGKQTEVDGALVRQLESDLHGAPIAAIHAAQVLAEPEKYPNFTKDARWLIRPYHAFASHVSYRQGYIPAGWPKTQAMGEEEETNQDAVFDGRVLRFYLRYLPWAHQDLPVGHPIRKNAGVIGARIRERLDNPDLLLLAGAVDLSRQTDPKKLAAAFESIAEPFRGPAYDAKGKHAEGWDRGDLVVTWPSDDKNGLFFAFRPSKIADPASLERFVHDLGIADVFRKTSGGCACGLNFGRYDVVDLTDFDTWLAWVSPGFQAMVDELVAPKVASGRWASDPRASKPDAVARVRDACDLDEDAATLLLQVRALADPTPARVMRSNGWDRARHDRAADVLVKRKLVVRETQPRTTRTLFLKGDVLVPRAPGAPIEASKAALYGLDPAHDAKLRAPFGVVLPLEPLDRLFDRVSRQ
jgi:hypothetical protein